MTAETKKAILAVSFGTSHNDTRKVTIDAIERDMQEAFPDYSLYRAWTSKMIIKKLKNRDNVHVFTVREAMEQMKKDGITDVLVQPTHVIKTPWLTVMIFTPSPSGILSSPAQKTILQ